MRRQRTLALSLTVVRGADAHTYTQVDFQPTPIKRVTPTGIELADGTHAELDVLVCATGYDYSFQLDFPMVGRGGATIQGKWAPHPETYLAVCTDGFPNWFMALGPNSGVGSGSLLVLIERQVDYAVEAARKMQRERLKSIEVKREAVEDFDEYLEVGVGVLWKERESSSD